MVSYPTAQNTAYNTFGGIRLRNGIERNGKMTAIICQNIDFEPQGISSNLKITSSLGNVFVAKYPDYKLIKGWETVQDGTSYCIIYAENTTGGVLLKYENEIFTELATGLTKTGEANGITMVDTQYDVFVFTNGINYRKVCFAQTPQVATLTPIYNGENVTGLALAEQDGSLVIGSPKGFVIASRKGDITDWDYVNPSDNNKAWYQTFGKPVTAVVPYIRGLLVFTPDDSTILLGNFSNASLASRASASLGGCMSFESWVLHDKYLFFYDNNQKNVYYFRQNDYGQTQLGEPIAVDVQKFFIDVKRLQFISYIANNKNEIWVLTDKNVLIFDYFAKEWSERVCQKINSYFQFDKMLYSLSDDSLLREKEGLPGVFNGVFYPSVYTTQTITFGSYSNLKEMELPPILTVSSSRTNKFWIDALIDDKKSKSKFLETKIISEDTATFYAYVRNPIKGNYWSDSKGEYVYPDNSTGIIIKKAKFPPEYASGRTNQLKGKLIPNYYTVRFTFRTDNEGQVFSICSFELKGISQETDTTGHK